MEFEVGEQLARDSICNCRERGRRVSGVGRGLGLAEQAGERRVGPEHIGGCQGRAQRSEAVQLARALRALGDAALASTNLTADLPALEDQAAQALRARGWQVDYLTVRRRADLQPPQPGDALVALGAARLGSTRLIDNLEI